MPPNKIGTLWFPLFSPSGPKAMDAPASGDGADFGFMFTQLFPLNIHVSPRASPLGLSPPYKIIELYSEFPELKLIAGIILAEG